MNNRNWRVLSLVMCAGLLWSFFEAALAEELTVGSAINKAGLQRMLIQRIGKAYCQLGLGVEPENSAAQLSESVNLFDSNLAELESFAIDPDVADALTQVKKIWVDVKYMATGPINREGAKRVAYWSDDLLYASHKVVQLLQDDANTVYAQLVNISGRQRMLSQRVAKFYMLQVWGYDTITVRGELQTARNEFSSGLAVLQAAPENTDVIKLELESVAADWKWFNMALDMADTDPFMRTVSGISELILVKMHRITGFYQKLSDESKQGYVLE